MSLATSGMVGSAIVRRLASEGCEILTATRAEVDLRRQDRWRPGWVRTVPTLSSWPLRRSAVFSRTTTYPADFLYDNLILQTNVIHAAHKVHVEKLMFLGSSCIYPEIRRSADR